MIKASVVMPVFNGDKYLPYSIESILNQTFRDFECIIIDDGSTDNSKTILKKYNDPRIHLVENEKNMGLVHSLNRGIDAAKGEYIIRMDQDDISLPNRFAEQIAFMEKHADVAVCGSWYKTIGELSGHTNKLLTDSEEIKSNLLFNASLAHPSVMIRRSVLEQHSLRYRKENEYFEDYGLWTEISHIAKLANIPKILLLYRVHKENISHRYSDKQRNGALHIQKKGLHILGLSPSPEEMRLNNSIRPKEKETATVFIKKEDRWLRKIIDANAVKKIYDDTALAKIIYLRWKTICGNNTKNGLAVWKQFVQSPIFQMKPYQLLDGIKIFIKCLIGK